LFSRYFDNLLMVGGLGLLSDALAAANRGSGGLLQWVAGPSVGFLTDVGSKVLNDPKKLLKIMLQRIPVAGQPIAQTVFPPKSKDSLYQRK
jgi:hypothetical protein